jgi:hypothetical protein
MKKIELTCERPKSDSITSMTEAFFGLKQGTLSSKQEEYDGDRTAADYADAEPVANDKGLWTTEHSQPSSPSSFHSKKTSLASGMVTIQEWQRTTRTLLATSSNWHSHLLDQLKELIADEDFVPPAK